MYKTEQQGGRERHLRAHRDGQLLWDEKLGVGIDALQQGSTGRRWDIRPLVARIRQGIQDIRQGLFVRAGEMFPLRKQRHDLSMHRVFKGRGKDRQRCLHEA